MRVLNTLYYYRPHFSGLTVYTERLAMALAAQGHTLTVLTSRYARKLPAEESLDGVRVLRVPVLATVSKGPIMPTFLLHAFRLLRVHDVLQLHVPQLDAAPLALLARLMGKPVVVTYHCDLSLPTSPLNRIANWASRLANSLALSLAQAVVTNTRDYAESSPALRRVLHKLVVIPPPSIVAPVDPARGRALRERFRVQAQDRLIGMAARLATEKGAEVLAQAMPHVLQVHPTARVLYVGQYQDVMGEAAYRARLKPTLAALGDRWSFLGVLDPEDMAAFYALCDVTVLPSLNSTESFGMVQVESMLCGTPVVASDLPGVRQPVQQSGMGLVVPPRDPLRLAQAINQVLADRARYAEQGCAWCEGLSPANVADSYQRLYARLLAGSG
jgi:glycosyltransferase involved in cell wall biosynthesis